MGSYGSPDLTPKDDVYEGMVRCRKCGNAYHHNLKRCPYCGASNSKAGRIVAILAVLVIIGGGFFLWKSGALAPQNAGGSANASNRASNASAITSDDTLKAYYGVWELAGMSDPVKSRDAYDQFIAETRYKEGYLVLDILASEGTSGSKNSCYYYVFGKDGNVSSEKCTIDLTKNILTDSIGQETSIKMENDEIVLSFKVDGIPVNYFFERTHEAHTLGEGKEIKKATCSETGMYIANCTVCHIPFELTIPKNAHTKGEWKVTKEPTLTTKGEESLLCSECGTVLETRKIDLSPEEYEEQYKKQCKSYTFKEIARNPDKYKGTYGKFKGEVIQVLENGNSVEMRVNITKEGSAYFSYWTDTIYVTYTRSAGEDRILENDIITFWGVNAGMYQYTSIFGETISLPKVNAKYLEID